MEKDRTTSEADKDYLNTYRHTTSHIMAQAVRELFPDVKLAIGPTIEDGFYYDFSSAHHFTQEDLAAIEGRMAEIVKRNLPLVRREMSRVDAIEFFEKRNEPFKVELIREIEDEMVSLYDQGDFVDLCRGPHLPATGKLKAFKLLSVAGAYWRGDEKNEMLQRIYGTSFLTKEELDKHIEKLEEIKRRDHRRLGRELDLFSIQDEIGAGLILWHPKGAVIRRAIEDFWKDEHVRQGYELVYSPHIARLDLWKTSGHWDFYRDSMYAPMEVEGVGYELKPMNCPFHIEMYNTARKSYRDLPIRWAELGTVYRFERSGALHGLMRVRGFTQDDAHIFCRPDQLEDEIYKVLDFTLYILRTFGFTEYDIFVSTRPEKYVGSLDRWELATNALQASLEKKGLPFSIDPGEGVFYGPKIDIKIKDVLGRSWQCTTVQVDFNLPDRFDVTYIGEDGAAHRPIMLHRALMGSLERFFGILIEHYAGAFPTWLAPVQVRLANITDKQQDFIREVADDFRRAGIRVHVDDRNEKLGFKVREATIAKIPYLLVCGDKEMAENAVSVRSRAEGDLGKMPLAGFKDRILKEISEKR